MKNNINYGDALCFVLAPGRTKEMVYLVLNELISGYKKIEGDYAFNLATDLKFENEEEILNHLEKNTTDRGTIYWNKEDNNPDRIMVGAYFTSDSQLILGLTVPGDGLKEQKYLESLKTILHSNIGVIYYNQFPDFSSGEDFKINCTQQ